MTAVTGSTDLMAQLRAAVGTQGPPQVARHAVNDAMIAHWCDAMNDPNPCYLDPRFAAQSVHRGIVAPPAMLDVWDRAGLRYRRSPDSPRGRMLNLLDEHGFVSVVAVTSELTFHRCVRPGEVLQNVEVLDDVSEEKSTALGIGHFVTTRHRYTTTSGDHVGDLVFRVLKFRPGTGRTHEQPAGAKPPPDPDPALRPRPAINHDNAFFWDGARQHELRIQRCASCDSLFSPPTTRCASCGSFDFTWTVASGQATLYSFAVPHYPQVNGFRYPLLVGLVELAEGVRLVSNVVGCRREDLRIGMPLELTWLDSHDAAVEGATDSRGTVSLPQFRPAPPPRRADTPTARDVAPGELLPLAPVPVTPTLIVSGAVATRDFQQVHHDRDIAQQRGSKDIFMNINTTVGLLQSYVTAWAGPEAIFRALRIRLGVPNYPDDLMTFSGRVESADAATGEVSVSVRGSNGLGDHVTGTVDLTFAQAGA